MSNPAVSIQSRLFGQYATRQEITSVIPLRRREQAATITKQGTINGDWQERTNRGESIVPILIDYIKTNQLTAGDMLPSEAQLSTALNVGNRSLREALMMLKALGVVEARQGVGWLISQFDLAANVPIVLGPLVQHFNQATIREVFEARLSIEPFIAELAARNSTPERLAPLDEVLEAMKKNVDMNPKEFRAADREFHNIIAVMCGNKVLSLQSSILSGLFLSVVIRLPCKDDYRVFQEHEEIYKKLVAGDADGAELAARFHIEEAIRYLKKCGLC